jgi:hypothetical protein
VAQPASFRIAVSGPGSGGSLPGAFPTPVLRTPAIAATAAELAAVELPTPVPPRPTATRPRLSAGSAATATAAQAPRARPTVTPPAQPPTQSGAAVPRAQTGAGNFNKLSDQAMEFDFTYPGGNQPVNVVVGANPPGSVAFSVYTDQQWQLMASGDFGIPPVGKGTANPVEPGNLFWQSVSVSPGLYHVRVYRLSEPASFWIALTGPGASELISLSPMVPE